MTVSDTTGKEAKSAPSAPSGRKRHPSAAVPAKVADMEIGAEAPGSKWGTRPHPRIGMMDVPPGHSRDSGAVRSMRPVTPRCPPGKSNVDTLLAILAPGAEPYHSTGSGGRVREETENKRTPTKTSYYSEYFH